MDADNAKGKDRLTYQVEQEKFRGYVDGWFYKTVVRMSWRVTIILTILILVALPNGLSAFAQLGGFPAAPTGPDYAPWKRELEEQYRKAVAADRPNASVQEKLSTARLYALVARDFASDHQREMAVKAYKRAVVLKAETLGGIDPSILENLERLSYLGYATTADRELSDLVGQQYARIMETSGTLRNDISCYMAVEHGINRYHLFLGFYKWFTGVFFMFSFLAKILLLVRESSPLGAGSRLLLLGISDVGFAYWWGVKFPPASLFLSAGGWRVAELAPLDLPIACLIGGTLLVDCIAIACSTRKQLRQALTAVVFSDAVAALFTFTQYQLWLGY